MTESTVILAPVFGEAGAAMSGDNIGLIVFISGLLLLGLVAIVGGFVMAGLNSRQAARRAEQEAALKKDMLDRGLSVDEIERLIRATAEQPKPPAESTDEDVDTLGELGRIFACCDPTAKPDVIEEVFAMARTADPKMRRAMVSAATEMHENSEQAITDEQIRAVVRALGRPAAPSTPTNDLPPLTATASRISDAFHLPE